jgi:CheY-like chemotaxis protein
MRKSAQKILIAEDEEIVLRLFSLFLERQGFSVISARDGQEALQKYLREKPDLLLTDINMPRMSGIELLAKIRERDKDLPTIFVSGQIDEKRDELAQDPKVEFMVKPVDYTLLCSRIENALTGW